MSTTPATSMAELLKNRQVTATALTKGQMIEGTITKLSSQEVLIDLAAKAEATVLEHDKSLLSSMLSTLHVGDKVMAQVLSTEGEIGLPVVSLRRFMDEMRWKDVVDAEKAKQKISVKVVAQVKGGYTVTATNGLGGFLPNSYVSGALKPGESIDVSVVEINRENRRFVVSQKTSISQDDFKKLSKKVNQKDIITVRVESVNNAAVSVAVLVDDGILPGVIFSDEVSWDKDVMLTPGEEVKALVTQVDLRNQRIVLSIKRITTDPLIKEFEKFPTDTQVSGTVIEVTESGVTLDINTDGLVGFIPAEKMTKDHAYTIGESVSCTVTGADTNARKILLAPTLLEKPMFYR